MSFIIERTARSLLEVTQEKLEEAKAHLNATANENADLLLEDRDAFIAALDEARLPATQLQATIQQLHQIIELSDSLTQAGYTHLPSTDADLDSSPQPLPFPNLGSPTPDLTIEPTEEAPLPQVPKITAPVPLPAPEPPPPPVEHPHALEHPVLRTQVLFLFLQVEPTSGKFLYDQDSAAATTLQIVNPIQAHNPDLILQIKKSNLSEAKGVLNASLRHFSDTNPTRPLEDILTQDIIPYIQHPNWLQIYHYITDHYGQLTVSEFIQGVTNRARYPSPDTWPIPPKHPRIIKQICRHQLTPGVHFQILDNQLRLAPHIHHYFTQALNRINTSINQDTLAATLFSIINSHRELLSITPHELTWDGNFQTSAFLLNSKTISQLSELLYHTGIATTHSLTPPSATSPEQALFQYARAQHLRGTDHHHQSFSQWIMTQRLTDIETGGRHTPQPSPKLQSESKHQAQTIIRRLRHTTEGFHLLLDPQASTKFGLDQQHLMYAYTFLIALIEDLHRHRPGALEGHFHDLTESFFNQ